MMEWTIQILEHTSDIYDYKKKQRMWKTNFEAYMGAKMNSSWMMEQICETWILTALTLGCDTVRSGRSSRTFRRNLLPPSSGLKSKPNKQKAE
jgi:hypothetical protein